MKKVKRLWFVCCTIAAGVACNNSSENVGSGDRTDSPSTLSSETHTPDKDVAAFAVKASNGSMMEIALGKMAQEKSASLRVKNFGAMMVKDHGEVNENLKSLAASVRLALPDSINESAKKEIDKLAKKKGVAFDQSYMKMMIEDHNKDLEEFRQAADKLSDSSFKTFAQVTLPVLSTHLDSAKAISGKNM
jgi:putative membrane protein